MPKFSPALLLILPALALGACGSSDSDSSTTADANTDEAQITTIVESVSADPVTVCDHLSADALRAFGDVATCRRAGEESGERGSETTIEDISVDGDTATVRLTDDRGPDTARFVKEDGEWKVQMD